MHIDELKWAISLVDIVADFDLMHTLLPWEIWYTCPGHLWKCHKKPVEYDIIDYRYITIDFVV